MVLILRDDHKTHLAYLTLLPHEALDSFCKMAVDTIKTGPNLKAYQKAAQKLETEVDTIKHAIEGLAFLMTQSAKHSTTNMDLLDTLLTLEFDEEQQKVIAHHYGENGADIRKILSQSVLDLPHYKDLEWRFEVQVASRALRHQIKPTITMRLGVENHLQGTQHLVLQTDPQNLQHLTEVLEQALQESRGQYFRRIQRNIK